MLILSEKKTDVKNNRVDSETFTDQDPKEPKLREPEEN